MNISKKTVQTEPSDKDAIIVPDRVRIGVLPDDRVVLLLDNREGGTLYIVLRQGLLEQVVQGIHAAVEEMLLRLDSKERPSNDSDR